MGWVGVCGRQEEIRSTCPADQTSSSLPRRFVGALFCAFIAPAPFSRAQSSIISIRTSTSSYAIIRCPSRYYYCGSSSRSMPARAIRPDSSRSSSSIRQSRSCSADVGPATASPGPLARWRYRRPSRRTSSHSRSARRCRSCQGTSRRQTGRIVVQDGLGLRSLSSRRRARMSVAGSRWIGVFQWGLRVLSGAGCASTASLVEAPGGVWTAPTDEESEDEVEASVRVMEMPSDQFLRRSLALISDFLFQALTSASAASRSSGISRLQSVELDALVVELTCPASSSSLPSWLRVYVHIRSVPDLPSISLSLEK